MFLISNIRHSYKIPRKGVNYLCLCVTENLDGPKFLTSASCMPRRQYSDDQKENSDKPVKCKVALITGGARGIGYSIAENLLKGGARAVVIGDVLVEECVQATCKLNEQFGEGKALFQPLDVTKKKDMENIFQCIKDRFGQLDIVVNNAGILADSRWEQTLLINIHGLVRGTFLGFQHMSNQNGGKGGVIINNASILGLQPFHGAPVYTGTKHFVIGFTRSTGSEYFCKQSGVKVMAVCPGVTETNMIWEAEAGGLKDFGDLGKECAKGLAALPSQGVDEVGKGVLTMIQDNDNGSIWVSEACEFYKVKITDRKKYRPPGPPAQCPPSPPEPPKPVCAQPIPCPVPDCEPTGGTS